MDDNRPCRHSGIGRRTAKESGTSGRHDRRRGEKQRRDWPPYLRLVRACDGAGDGDRLRAAGRRRADDFSMASLAARYAEIYEDLARADRREADLRAARPRVLSRWFRGLRRMMQAIHRG